jgi:aromatic-L-amino-acid decarboxylase
MTIQPPAHLSPDEFRRWGHAFVDWICAYRRRIESFPVLSQVAPGEIRSRLPIEAPAQGEPFESILADLDNIILPGITHWQSPRFFAYFPANSSPPSILGELVSAGLSVQGMLWLSSPACTELETHVLDWIVGMLGLPEAFLSTRSGGGVIQDSGSSGNLCALLAARERATGFESNETGCRQPLTVYASVHAHSSIEKGAGIAGIGRKHLRLIDVDGAYAMRPDALERAIAADRAAGLLPCAVVATVGTTSVCSIDPVRAVGEICRKHDLWLHVDGAYAGSAAVCPEFRFIHDGLELADSFCFNPHKWLLTNFDCDCFFVADRNALTRTFSIDPEYLKNVASQSGHVIDYRDWHVPLGRRFRALKLWFVIRHYGVEGLRKHIRHHVELARRFSEWVENDSDFEIAAPTCLSIACFRHRAGDAVNRRIQDAVNRSGDVFLTHTRLEGRRTLRMAIGGTETTLRHVELAWRRIRESAASSD